ncbi:MAG: hypothetical protein JNJ58_07340 [Chitinophagaceae bacterium]|nr:hypothetical protein [Chitinophagaceae bacterium]
MKLKSIPAKGLLILFILLNHELFARKVTSVSINEIQNCYQKMGIDSALKLVSGKPICLIDSSLAFELSKKCIGSLNSRRVWFLLTTASFFKNEELCKMLLYNLDYYRVEYLESPENISYMDSRLICHIIFQKHPTSISILKQDFEYWHNEEKRLIAKGDANDTEYQKRICRNVQGYIITALSLLNEKEFVESKLKDSNSVTVSESLYCDALMQNHLNAKPDTVKLVSSFNSLDESVLKETILINQFDIWGKIDNKWDIALVYNNNSGIVSVSNYIGHGGWDATYMIRLLTPNTIEVKLVRAGLY